MAEHMDATQDRVKEAPMTLKDYFAFRRSVKLERSLRNSGSGAADATDPRIERRSGNRDTEVAVAIG
jgi:hypothetical protein